MSVRETVRKIVECFERGEQVALTLCDLSKTIDSVYFDILLLKLEKYSFRDLTLEFSTSYLYGRQQCVFCNGSFLDLKSVNFGVPQGFIAGSCLFVIYLNDIFHYIHPNTYISYVDNTSLLTSHNHINALQILLKPRAAETWFLSNNPAK